MDAPGRTDGDLDTPRMQNGGRAYDLTFWLGTALAALLGAAVGVFFVLPLGLIAAEYVIFPLALGVGAMLASLAAGWAANLLAHDGSRTKFLRVAVITEAAAVVLSVVFLVNAALRVVLLGPVFYPGLFGAVVLAVAAALAAGRFRVEHYTSNDRLLTLWLLLIVVVSVPAVILLAWAAGLTGA